MDQQDVVAVGFLFCAMAVAAILRRRRNSRRQGRRWWTHPINLLRNDEGAWASLMKKFRTQFPDKHEDCLRMNKTMFDQILTSVKPVIEKSDTHLRQAISSEQRLCVTLYFLAHGDSIRTLALFFRMGESTVRSIIHETCEAIWETMSNRYLRTPTSPQEWRNIASEFNLHWQFPNCLGAVDGKHCSIRAPPNSGSDFFNYKKTFSIVLLAVSDALYKFVYVDVGTPGRWSDGGTFDHSTLNESLNNGLLNIPADTTLPGCNRIAPFAFVADEAFPLKTFMMKPYPGRSTNASNGMQKRIFNYRLSRARRTVENAFGILVARWRCLRGTLHMSSSHARSVVLACCVLHNFLREQHCETYCPPGYADVMDTNGEIVEGTWRTDPQQLVNINHTAQRNSPALAIQARETFMDYFNNEGALPWQSQHVLQI